MGCPLGGVEAPVSVCRYVEDGGAGGDQIGSGVGTDFVDDEPSDAAVGFVAPNDEVAGSVVGGCQC